MGESIQRKKIERETNQAAQSEVSLVKKESQEFHILAMFLLDHFLYANKKGLVTDQQGLLDTYAIPRVIEKLEFIQSELETQKSAFTEETRIVRELASDLVKNFSCAKSA